MNLLKETLQDLKENNKESKDVRWCGSKDMWFTWEEFIEVASINYDSGYGGQEIATDLLIVGDDWWLERHEYAGSEWWEFKKLPVKSDLKIIPRKVKTNMSWDTLAELHKKEVRND